MSEIRTLSFLNLKGNSINKFKTFIPLRSLTRIKLLELSDNPIFESGEHSYSKFMKLFKHMRRSMLIIFGFLQDSIVDTEDQIVTMKLRSPNRIRRSPTRKTKSPSKKSPKKGSSSIKKSSPKKLNRFKISLISSGIKEFEGSPLTSLSKDTKGYNSFYTPETTLPGSDSCAKLKNRRSFKIGKVVTTRFRIQ